MKSDPDTDGSNIVRLQIKPKQQPAEERDRLIIVEQSTCAHVHCTVDPELLELKCSDCGSMLNPITFVVKISEIWRLRDLAHKRRLQAFEESRAEAEKRRRCRCEHCGKTTRIRRVSNRELGRIRAAAESEKAERIKPDGQT